MPLESANRTTLGAWVHTNGLTSNTSRRDGLYFFAMVPGAAQAKLSAFINLLTKHVRWCLSIPKRSLTFMQQIHFREVLVLIHMLSTLVCWALLQ